MKENSSSFCVKNIKLAYLFSIPLILPVIAFHLPTLNIEDLNNQIVTLKSLSIVLFAAVLLYFKGRSSRVYKFGRRVEKTKKFIQTEFSYISSYYKG